jgi:phosphoserine phosphatase RsbU/P
VFYGHYHVRSGELVFTNAGHNPPYLVRADGRIESLGGPNGPIVGIAAEVEYSESRLVLDPDDLLVVYTDGVTEGADREGEMLGEKGLEKILAEVRALSVEEVCRAVLRQGDQFRDSPDQDDVTLLALRRQRS